MRQVVGGKLVDGHGGEADPVLNPASEEVLAEIVSADADDVARAVDAAREAAPAWGRATPATRATALLHLADLLDERTEELARIEAANVGKPLDAAAQEIPLCSDHLRFFAGAARVPRGPGGRRVRRGLHLDDPARADRRRGPDHALELPAGDGHLEDRPALAAGNTIVLKPSELTPLSTLRLAELALELLPPGVFNVVTGRGNPVGEAIVTNPAVKMVSLTGWCAPARRSPPRPPTRWPGSTSSWVARRRSWCSTTPT